MNLQRRKELQLPQSELTGKWGRVRWMGLSQQFRGVT